MSNIPKVSVIVPIYNNETELKECVDSILNQVISDIEIILVDDGSTDKSSDLCDKYAKMDPRVRTLHKIHEGVGIALNSGIKIAVGDYIGFVEPWDYVDKEMYYELLKKAIEHDTDVVKSLYTIANNGKIVKICNKFGRLETTNCIIENSLLIPQFAADNTSYWSAIYSRQFILRNNIQFLPVKDAVYSDIYFNWQVFATMRRCYIFSSSYYYRNIRKERRIGKFSMKELDTKVNMWKELFIWLSKNGTKHAYFERYVKDAYVSLYGDQCHNYQFASKRPFAYKKLSAFFKMVVQGIKFSQFHVSEKRCLIIIQKHPVVASVWDMLYKKKKKNKEIIKKFLGIQIWKHIRAQDHEINYFFYFPLLKKERKGQNLITRLFGMRIWKSQISVSQERNQAESLRSALFAQAISRTHQRTFPKYKDSNRGCDVMIVACGPTVKYAPIFDNTKYLAVNKAITFKQFRFDYCFMQDYLGVSDCIQNTYDYGCINFFGKYIYERNQKYGIPEYIAEKAHAERYYSEGSCTVYAYQDIENFPLADFCTVVHPALHFLLYTRPKHIYLVGCDTANNGYLTSTKFQLPMNIKRLKSGYLKIKEMQRIYYPDVEIISINPIGLRGIFHDVYTSLYVREHPEIIVNPEFIIS